MRNAQDPSKVIVLRAGFSAHADFPLVKGMRRAVLDYVQADQGRFFSCENMREQFYEGLKEADGCGSFRFSTITRIYNRIDSGSVCRSGSDAGDNDPAMS